MPQYFTLLEDNETYQLVNGRLFTQEELNGIVQTRLQRADASVLNGFVTALGFESPEEVSAFVSSARENASSNEALTAQVQTLTGERDDALAQIRQSTIASQLIAAANQANVLESALPNLGTFIDFDGVELVDGQVQNPEDIIKTAVEAHPYIVGSKTPPNTPPKPPKGGKGGGGNNNKMNITL